MVCKQGQDNKPLKKEWTGHKIWVRMKQELQYWEQKILNNHQIKKIQQYKNMQQLWRDRSQDMEDEILSKSQQIPSNKIKKNNIANKKENSLASCQK